MASIKVIKRRIASVTTTKKIMKAMNMVAASKLQKDKVRLEAARPFVDASRANIDNVRHCENAGDNIYFQQRDVKNIAYLIITSDRGLCGGYNTNLAEEALRHIESSGKKAKIVAVGIKGYDYFIRHGKKVLRRFDDVLETAFYEDAERIGNYLTALYSLGKADEVYMAYTEYKSALSHIPQVVKLLPLGPEAEPKNISLCDMEYEPNVSEYLGHAIPMYISAYIYAALLESSTCEQAARMVSMDAATENATEIINKLTQTYNRRRQSAITQEISEIVGSANSIQ